MKRTIQLGISTCPNDTFAFHGLMTGASDLHGLTFDVQLMDVQQLNDRLLQGQFDVAKTSFHAALMMARETVVLRSGAALGFGVGPLLLSRHADRDPAAFLRDRQQLPTVLCPGGTTTATLLYRLFYDSPCDMKQVVFSEIMPALQDGTADFGVCIHEGRFTWQESGLHCVADLGERWEQQTGVALPLGGIIARRNLDPETITRVGSAIRSSIEYGLAHRQETLPSMRKYAAEFQDDVLFSHVDLYVNEHTIDLGETGRRALEELSALASRLSGGDNPGNRPCGPLTIWPGDGS